MLSLRRTTVHLKKHGIRSEAVRIIGGCYPEKPSAGFIDTPTKPFHRYLAYASFFDQDSFRKSKSKDYFRKSKSKVKMSTQVVSKSSGDEEQDSDDGFSELGSLRDVDEEDSVPEPELSKEEDDSLTEADLSKEEDVSDNILDVSEFDKKKARLQQMTPMTKAILDNHQVPVRIIMEKWVEDGNKVTQTQVSLTMLYLRKRGLYLKAFQLSEWLESSKQIEFGEANYASRVDLISRVLGLARAEDYVNKIPEAFRTELIYRSLLASCVARSDTKKSIEVFDKIKNLGCPVTSFSCNQMLLLYLKTDKKKIADILLLMEKENIKPTLFTYQILISAKGRLNDINGMEKVVEAMKAEGVQPSTQIQVALASYYANSGLKDKAEAILKEMEGGDLKKNRWACQFVLPIYASMGMESEVERIWDVCEPDAWLKECTAAIEAWGKLNKIEKAEAAFEKKMKIVKNPISKHFMPLLSVYADHKLMVKGKDLVKRMGGAGCKTGPDVWDVLVKLYVGVGEVEKADSMLEKASKYKKGMFTSYFAILENYAMRGDVPNAERIFLKMRNVGYEPRIRQYQALLQAYLKAKAPAYGFAERMRGDGVLPNTVLAKHLAQSMNEGRKTEASDLLL